MAVGVLDCGEDIHEIGLDADRAGISLRGLELDCAAAGARKRQSCNANRATQGTAFASDFAAGFCFEFI